MFSHLSKRRLWVLDFFIFTLFFLILNQLIQLTIVRRPALRALADSQHNLHIEIPPYRGMIVDRTGKEFATNLKVPSIYAAPRLLAAESRPVVIRKLQELLRLDKKFLEERLGRNKAFVWLKRRTTFEESEQVLKIKSPVLGVVEESKRFYPQGDLLAQILGYTNVDNEGIEGLELFLQKELSGRPGKRITRRDALGREVKAFETQSVPALDGHSVTLTIDQHLQYLTERALERSFSKWKAKGATAVVMDPQTGEILALANRPTYDPNNFSKSNPESRRNRTITDTFEPGSIFKIVTASAALNEGVVTPETVFFCENGKYNYGIKVLHDVHAYGNLSFEEVIIKSSNIGSVKIAAKMKPEVFYSYVQKFGFSKPTGVDFPGEVSGFSRPPSQWSKTTPFNMPIGHEIMVTAIQVTAAVAVIANGGNLVKPYLISKIKDPHGVTIKENRPQIKHRVLRPEVAYKMRKIMERVVNEGTGKAAKIDEIPTGGKTGTAQKVLPGGRGYSHSNFFSSFVGLAPIEEPRLVMTIMVDDPHPSYYGGTVAAPVFREVVEAGLLYIGYVPERAKMLGGTEPSKPSTRENPPKRPSVTDTDTAE